MELNQAKITVKGPAVGRNQQTKVGPRMVYEQPAQLSAEGLVFQFPLSVSSIEEQYPVGDYIWNSIADVVPTQYGPELSRRMTLVPIAQARPAPISAAK